MTLREVAKVLRLGEGTIIHVIRPHPYGRIDLRWDDPSMGEYLDKRFQELYWNGSQLCVSFE